ncbi:hypothetical protein F0P96_19995 [Hymenobacter busanensis]|uniref:Uncharacterized protein n=1 Tax=Hymenobacter busanensis TaxID=2607656 RepID=A0A7L5A1W6_9BACT|nr:hypothetical protein [Hymenobacter busanensis]KAA9325287.1 hypothetical protein F0P96_19995 [Hymenobacter busanensis]QHJ07720.1 hypothetical protein GUY19_10645 [Hymenobacter busanensis]
MLLVFRFQLIMLLLAGAVSLQARPYDPLLRTTKWNCMMYDFQTRYPFSYSLGGQVIRNGTTYSTLLGGIGPFLVREDSVAQRVYVIFPNDHTERLLYDFRVNVGQQVSLTFGPGTGFIRTCQVVRTDSVLTDAGYRRRILLSGSPSGSLEWIEGMGDTHSPVYQADATATDPSPQVQCAYRGAQRFYSNAFATGCPLILNAAVGAAAVPVLRLAPTEDALLVTAGQPLANLTVSTLTGTCVAALGSPAATVRLPTTNWAEGLYVISAQQTDGRRIHRKYWHRAR